ncbi:hypothetical protein SPBR_01535 [Sporothrix brasiliensis 5110]|uniref:Uncharacterized protein n=1 Tax=Sporothrix brasiliensis 5110 TaxID=1398154 RepID=A0A0C2IW88_9PEZI|nr:uncharacterized protein SPBR_01535 [Sporothrix brasiliensis 5110]KIH91060.1 hypothetical protein SPBR_01535 [Sporothrix brasiliensis 5110]
MSSVAIPKSRLDTLPVEVLRQIFDMAFSDTVDEESEWGSECSDEDSSAGSDISSVTSPSLEDSDVFVDPNGYESIVKGIADDRLNSDLVRRLASEQLYRNFTPSSLDAFNSGIHTFQADPGMGNSVRRAQLWVLAQYNQTNSDKMNNAKGVADHLTTTKKQRKRINKLKKQHEALLHVLDTMEQDMPSSRERSYAYEKPAYWARVAVQVQDFLGSVPGLQKLTMAMAGLAVIPMEEDRDNNDENSGNNKNKIILRRLQSLEMHEFTPDEYRCGVLDTDGLLMRCAPNLRELSVMHIGNVVSSKALLLGKQQGKVEETEEAHLERLEQLYIGHSPMSAASLKRLLSTVGPRLATVDMAPALHSARPSHLSFDKGDRNFSTYDLLEALAPWKTTSLTSLTITMAFAGQRVAHLGAPCEEYAIPPPPGPSAMALLAGFTSVRTLCIDLALLDWRGAGTYADAGRNGVDTTTGVAASLVAQLPPNIESVTFDVALYQNDFDVPMDTALGTDLQEAYQAAWKPRRAALVQALVAATRDSRFPNLTTIKTYPHADCVTYNVTTTADEETATTTRTITLETEYTDDIVANRRPNVYDGVTDEMAVFYDNLLRPASRLER